MEILIQWVTQIIIFLLLASIIDLLIPSSAMKKYINLVVGLILILIFLRPVFFLFDINVEQALEASYARLSNGQVETAQVESLMKKQKKEIQASQSAYIEREVEIRLKEVAETPLQQKYQAKISNMDFTFSSETNPTYENLSEVVVYLQESEVEEGVVNDVDEVVINTDKEVKETEEKNVEGIKELLKEVWEIRDKKPKLTILWEGGTS